MKTIWIDLVMDTGELVRIECPQKYEDELHDALEMAMKRRDWFATARFDGCTAEFLGLLLERINMARVVGTL